VTVAAFGCPFMVIPKILSLRLLGWFHGKTSKKDYNTQIEEKVMTDELIAIVWMYGGLVDGVTLCANRKEAYAKIRKEGNYKQCGQDGTDHKDYWDTPEKGGGYAEAIVWDVEMPDGFKMISKYV
jgi:hypothetical protein